MIQPVLLQSCSDALDCWGSAEFFEALATRIDVVMGMAAFMMIIAVVTYICLYYWSKTHVVPTVVLVLSGGVVMSMLPAAVARIGWIIILIAGALALFGILWAVIK